MLSKYFSVVILCLTVVNGNLVEPGEPKCLSKFDYDEKMLMKQLRLEDKVQKFEDFINEVKAKGEKEKEERVKLLAVELEKFKQENAEEIARQKNVTSVMLKDLANSKIELEEKMKDKSEPKKEEVVAFTVSTPAKGTSANSMTFTEIITNEGNGFDTSTGTFTCPVNGLYYFSLHIMKKRSSSTDAAGCSIYLNGTGKVRAFVDPQDGSNGADNGSYGASNSVYLILKVGDVVTIEGCTSRSSDDVESQTSFSGYLEERI
ncbi:complement C1q subcomponent subunit C-like [Ruditapes philippinarum]|uniref:complement C1q subcomponent subunit C-like n=1 Tax=Ruditapes philippinarum TaxID=129788 RepID=UPI00295C3192|nr:complement C1q subcomponent subunit C-like [Ruditapes philippinarum]